MYSSFFATVFVKYKNDESGSIANKSGFYNFIDLLADSTIIGTFDSLCYLMLTLEMF
jgi:hypothetical protein